MGVCCCKSKSNEDEESYLSTTTPATVHTPAAGEPRVRSHKAFDPKIVDNLVLEMLGLIASFVDSSEDSSGSLVKLRYIADKEEGWIQVLTSMVNVIPLEDPFGASAITIVLDDCPLPSRESVIKVTKLFNLSSERAQALDLNVRTERNICVIIGCIADKLAGPNSLAILTKDTLDYLLSLLILERDPCIVLFALLALEKFAQTTENKLTIKKRLDETDNPLLSLEKYHNNDNLMWRQVGFCAKWALDNTFTVEGRRLTYEVIDMTGINVILNTKDVSEYLKISPDGLEARCDSYSFESVRCTFQVDNGCWYYESTIITPGVMQIGWATKNSHFLNHEGYGIGDDHYSLSYDGCRRLIWYKAQVTPAPQTFSAWQPGDVLGCLIDIESKEVIFNLNGTTLNPCKDIFETTRNGFFAAASFMAFQQCRFNFGHEPFRYPPKDREFSCFNDFGTLTSEEKQVVPRRIFLEQFRCSSFKDDSCTLCFDDTACCILEPCGHKGFCSVCTSQLKECPMCRAAILHIRHEEP